MYQLRGRVGRSHERAFAYFFFPPQRELTEEAHDRLTTIARHQALGSGFRIALRDLEIRGAGNVLGAEQHGHIAAVGFDTYARLLQESVAEMKGEPLPEEVDIRIDLPVRAFVPPGWLEQEALRLDLYRRIGAAGDHEALERVRAEAVDRYGALPEEVDTLLAVASLRLTAARLGVEEISTYRQQVRVKPLGLTDAAEHELGRTVPGSSYHRTTATLNLDPDRVAGTELPGWVERHLLLATGEDASVASINA
jgi:transcription-repair coupling factor (superfamily II helicase)